MAGPSPLVSDILAHHGIKGMKWGVRREGLSTAVSNARQKVKQEVADRQSTDVIVRTKPGGGVHTVGGNKRNPHPDAIAVRRTEQIVKRSTLDAVSNTELQQLVQRMNLEQQYRNLSVNETRQSSGEKTVLKLLDEHGDQALSKLGIPKVIGGRVTKTVTDTINGNKAFDTGKASAKNKGK